MDDRIVISKIGMAGQMTVWQQEGLSWSTFSPLSASDRLASYMDRPPDTTIMSASEKEQTRLALQEAGPVLARPEMTFTLRMGGGFRSVAEEVICFSKGKKPAGLLLDGKDAVVVLYGSENAVLDGYISRHACSSEQEVPNLIPPLTEPDAFLFLLHAIDMYRRSFYASMLAYAPQSKPGVSLEAYRKDMEHALRARDMRWLLGSFLMMMSDFPVPATARDPVHVLVEAGFCEVMKDPKGMPWLAFTEVGASVGAEFERTWYGSAGYELKAQSGDRNGVVGHGYLAPTSLTNHVVRMSGEQGKMFVNHQAFRAIQLKTHWMDLLSAGWKRVEEGWPEPTQPEPTQQEPAPPEPARPKPANRFCAYCGQQMESGSRFCDHCGKPVA